MKICIGKRGKIVQICRLYDCVHKKYRFHQKGKNTIRTDRLKINPQDLVLVLSATKVLAGRKKKQKCLGVGRCLPLTLLVLRKTCT